MSLLKVENLSKHYEGRRGLFDRLTGVPETVVRAVNGINLTVERGEILGLIGESGCGKSTLGRAILRLHEPTAGKVVFDGTDMTALDPAGLKAMRRRMQIIFQDPYASLNPRRTVAEIVGLPLKLHRLARSDAEAREIVARICERVADRAGRSRPRHGFGAEGELPHRTGYQVQGDPAAAPGCQAAGDRKDQGRQVGEGQSGR